ncbi:MAG: HypC/HybG/HupF family hydrogenase formation chaperone [Nitrososphaerales archaeon]|jgi:hydrogenase maturation factor
MCVTRVGQVLSIEGGVAKVRFMDTGSVGDVDVSMVDARKNSYVEIFVDQAIGRITKKEAEFKRDLRLELEKMRVASR